jgi:hypothetical protein
VHHGRLAGTTAAPREHRELSESLKQAIAEAAGLDDEP